MGVKMKQNMQIVLSFFDGVRKEFSRVIWPTKGELGDAAIIVFLFVLVYTIYLGSIDFSVKNLLSRIF